MAIQEKIGRSAVLKKGIVRAHKWLILRRLSQLSILGLFLLGPWFDIWVIKGNLAASVVLETVPLTDPYVLMQSALSGVVPENGAILGVVIVVLFYLLVGGRVYCSWVCPVNMVTDAAAWLRRKLGLRSSGQIHRSARYWLLGMTLLLALVTGNIVWELFNPVSMLFRGVVFGLGLAWFVVLGVFLFDLLVVRDGWCGRLCPVGAFYSLLGSHSPVRVVADQRSRCNDCMDCFVVCPEAQVIKPALKGEAQGLGPVVSSVNCTNCGRCIDVCSKDVFRFANRYQKWPVGFSQGDESVHSRAVGPV